MSDSGRGSDDGRGWTNRKFTRGEFLKAGGTLAAGSAIVPLISACGNNQSSGSSGKKDLSGTQITIATVSNPQMTNMQKLVGDFTKKTGIKTKFLTLNELDLRKKITQDISMGTGQFDILMLGNYETPIYAQNNWLEPLDSYFSNMSGKEKSQYDLGDILSVWKTSLSYKNQRYSLPFYGESSMLFYRKDLFQSAGLKMPENPKWEQVASFAEKLDSADVNGMVLRGEPGWGANMGAFTTVMNTFGGRWFNMNWEPQLTSPQFKKAATFYAMLARKYGQSGITSDNFPECENVFSSGKGAMWYDATSAAGYLSDPKTSKVADKVGFTYAPTAVTPHGSHWLWTWALAIEAASKNKDAAFEFLKWATGKNLISLMGKKLGWENALPGTRESTYKSTPYGKKPWADVELKSIKTTNPDHPTMKPVPYTGIQFVGIPEWQSLGDQVGRYFAQVLAGKESVDKFAKQAQQAALQVSKQGKYLKG